jgi:hypothetical protein
LTLLNGQTGNICCTDGKRFESAPTLTNCNAPDPTAKTEAPAAGFRMSARPEVSADRRFVRVALDIEEPGTLHLHSRVVLPDSGTVVFGGFKKVISVQQECGVPVLSRIPYVNRCFTEMRCVPVTQQTFVLVTPRVLAVDEEEERPTGFKISPCEPASSLCPDDHNAEPKQGSTLEPTLWASVTRLWGEIFQTYVPSTGLTLPTGHYLEHLPQYTPPAQQVPLPLELATKETIVAQPTPYATESGVLGQSPPVPRWVPATSAAQLIPCAAADVSKGRQAEVIVELLKAYDEACASGHTAEAKKYAKAALLIDPTCFHKK